MKKLFITALMLPISVASIAFYGVNAQNTVPKSVNAENSNLSEKEQAKLDKALAGRTSGPAQNCISRIQQRNLTYVNDDILIFGSRNAKTIYVNKPVDGCPNAQRYALSYSRPGTSLCSGDIAQIVDVVAGSTLGSCAFSKFVPYTKTK